MKIYGLIGNPLGHSFSPQIHKALGGYNYGLFQMEADEVAPFLAKKEFDGINVTIPYKQAVMPYLDRISDEAVAIGSVNTVVKEANGTLTGYNTDAFGFEAMLCKGRIDVAGKKALILGSGGSSKTAQYVLSKLGASSVTVISRSGENSYDNLDRHENAQIIVNTTPLGMFPKNGAAAVDLNRFSRLTGAIDIVYNPEKTAFLLQAERLGVPHVGGLYMLVAQAARASEYFTGKSCSEQAIERAYSEINFGMRNIILVGMPGCGKSTVGARLAELLGRECIDCDAYFEAEYGKSPAYVITNDGEQTFRKMETEVLKELTKRSGIVLCTGGGCVTVPENHDLLRQNGRVVFINRDISLLESVGRPLSAGGRDTLEKMFDVRCPLYKAVCDFEIKADKSSTPEGTARKIADLVK